MIPVSEELKNAFNTGNQKDLTLYFSDNTSLTNENIVAESMSLEQILCDEEQINFGLCNAASFKITILNSNTSRVGQTVTPVITIRGTEYSMQLGVFKIVEDRVTDDRLHRNITAYDALYDIVNTDYASWYTSLTFPMTLKQFRDSFFTHIGLTQVSASLINDSMTVEKTVDADVFSGSDIIKAICELNAVFGCIDNEGHFKYIPFVHEGGVYPEEDLFPADDLYPNDGFDVIVSGSPYSYVSGSFVYEDYVVQRITGLAIVEDESDTSELYGTDENLYMITGNYLLFGKNATDLRTVAENFLGFVGRFQYKPARIRMRAMPWVELGDIIGVVGKKGNAVFPILKRTMSGITALYDDYEAQGKEYYSFSANTVSSMVEKLKSKTMRIVANVDEISTELTEYETQTDGTLSQHSSLIQQNANQILLRVEKDGVISAINQSAEQVQISASKINLQGYVTVTDLSGSGTTTVNGDRVRSGSLVSNNGTMIIDLDNNTITAKTLIVDATNFNVSSTGVVTATGATLNSANVTGGIHATSITIDNNIKLKATFTNPLTQVEESKTYTLLNHAFARDIHAGNTVTGEVNLKNVNGTTCMSLYYDESSSVYPSRTMFYKPVRFLSSPWVETSAYLTLNTPIRTPSWGTEIGKEPTLYHYNLIDTNNSQDSESDYKSYFGHPKVESSVWPSYLIKSKTYVRGQYVILDSVNGAFLGSSSGTAITSDERLKDLYEIDSKYEEFFMRLNPVLYKYKDQNDDVKFHRLHIGFGAQSVEKALEDSDLTTEDFAGVVLSTNFTKDNKDEAPKMSDKYDELYSLRYEEFIALNTHMVQKLYERIQELEEKING